jgi:hypothetical protein
MVLSFYEHLYSNWIRHEKVDRLVWNLSKRGSFEVKTFYRALANQEAVSFPWKSITIMFLFRKLSKVKIFPKVAVHTKNATLGGTLTFQILFHGKED